MNERIYELAESCTVDFVDGRGVSLSEIDVEKFAELIVKECVDICMKNQFDGADNYNNGSISSAEFIKQHFGVEE
jgi:hypothetical protein